VPRQLGHDGPPQGEGPGARGHRGPAGRALLAGLCVIASSVFGDTPAPGAPFGRAADTPGHEVLCTNPASLGADRRRTVTTLLRREPFPGLLGAGLRLLHGVGAAGGADAVAPAGRPLQRPLRYARLRAVRRRP
jgi:hypothetical protein